MIIFSSKAYELIELLTEADQASVGKVKGIVKEVQDKFFSEHNLPMPEIKIRDYTNVQWLGREIIRLKPLTGEILLHQLEIQKGIINDEETLKRVITHEMIHLWQNVTTDPKKLYTMHKLGLSNEGHGSEFRQYAEKINAIMGKDYVTENSDETYKVESTKEYYILIQPHTLSGEHRGYGWTWAARPSVAQKEMIKERQQEKNAKLFKIKEPRWLSGAPIKKYGGYSLPRAGLNWEKDNKELEQIYNSGKEITI